LETSQIIEVFGNGVRNRSVRQWEVKMHLDAQKQELVPPKKLERECRKDIIRVL